MVDLVALKAANEKRWASAKLTANYSRIAKALVDAKPRYQSVETKTGVPWPVIAVIHMRESSQSWGRSLAQGDPWDRVSTRVPAGRGPFKSWEEAAIDALANCAPYLARNRDWSIAETLTKLEQYNGLGYAARGRPSPYIWSGTSQYKSGKYIRDGVYDPHAVDRQPGCAGLLIEMMALDASIRFDVKKSSNTHQPSAMPSPGKDRAAQRPSIQNPKGGSIGAFVKSILTAIFRKK
jgi:lysozyme family protein